MTAMQIRHSSCSLFSYRAYFENNNGQDLSGSRKYLISLDFLCGRWENLRRQGLEEIEASSSPLNATNRIRGQSCLESILVFSSIKIYSKLLFTNISLNFPFSASFSSRKKFSSPAKLISARGDELNFGMLHFSAAKFLKKELNMQLYCIHGGLSDQNSAQIQLENKKFSCNNKNSAGIYRKRKNFALEFIQKNNIALENFSTHADFPSLTKNEKDSIRYHLKKRIPQVIKSTSLPVQQKKKGRVEKLSSSLALILIPIFSVEVVICLLSARFYTSLGIESQLAFTLAIAVECFYMASSAMTGMRFKGLRLIILAYSIFTVGYSNLISDSNLINEKEAIKYQITQKETTLGRLEGDLDSLRSKEKVFIASMEGYNQEKYISRGLKNVTPLLDQIEKRKTPIKNKVAKLQIQLSELKKTQREANGFTFNSLSKLQISTYAIIIGFIIVQICSSVFLSPSLNSLGQIYKKIINQIKRFQRTRYAH